MLTINPAPKYKVIGHRGVAGLRPENTYTSFKYAAELGLNWIEFDAQLTKDSQWVVIHDDTLERTTNGKGLVCEHTFAELEQLEAGLWFDPPYPRQPIPNLLHTTAIARRLDLHCNIEIKNAEIDPEKHAVLMARFVQQHLDPISVPPLFSSFSLPCLINLRAELPSIPIAYLVDQFDSHTVKIAKQYDFCAISCNVNNVTKADIWAAAGSNLPVLLYTINDRKLAKHWLDEGVAAIFSDRPDLFTS